MPADWSIDAVLAFIAANRAWGTVVFALLAFGESLAFIGMLVPATGVLIAAGALVGAGVISFWELWIGGTVGAVLGDSISYWFGRRFGPEIQRYPPFRTRPHLLAAAERVFTRWGWAAVFFGRFIGPLRATIPLAAGMLAMRPAAFQMANVGSAVVWIPVLIVPGAAVTILVDEFRSGNETIAVLIGLLLGAVILGAVVAVRRYAPRILGNGRPDGGV